jgi:RNA polymerase sigma factor (sigma-70 family)
VLARGREAEPRCSDEVTTTAMSPKISIRLLGAQSDQRLAALAAAGHERAFETLVHRYRRPLLRYCRRMGLNDARADDVLQQAFLRAWLAFARQTDVRDVRAWLYRIVHNAAVNAMRGGGEHHSELTDAIQTAASVNRESELQRRIAVRDALTDVAALPQMQQQAIFLTAVDGQSHEEVATVLGVSEGAVRGLLYRARATLRSAAAALTPPQLLEWAARGGGAGSPGTERLAELSAGGGAAGMTGLLAKGAVVAVTAGAIATGGAVVSSPGRHAKGPAQRPASSPAAAASSGLAARAFASTSPVALVDRAQSSNTSSGRRSGRDSSTHDDRSSASAGDHHRGSRADDGELRGQGHDGVVRDLSRADGRGTGSRGGGGPSGSTRGGDGSGSGDSGSSGGGSRDTTMLTAAADPARSTSSHDGASTTESQPVAALTQASTSGPSGGGSGSGDPPTSIASPGSGSGSDG